MAQAKKPVPPPPGAFLRTAPLDGLAVRIQNTKQTNGAEAAAVPLG